MPLRYILSAEAVGDLLELRVFLTEREGEERALTIIARLHRIMTALSEYPGRQRGDLEGSPYSHPVQSWMIFYRPTTDRTAIEIVRVIDGRRDIRAMLGPQAEK
jgi:plasmid stabilization system protein ParE